MTAPVRPLRRTFIAYVCAWCRCQYAHAWTPFTGEPVVEEQQSDGICPKCLLVQLRALNRDTTAGAVREGM